MNEYAFPLSVTTETLLVLPVSEALKESKKAESWHYGQVFHQKAREAETAGNSEKATAWRLLAQLAQIMLREGNVNEPFRPIGEGLGTRSLLPSDLDDASADAVRELGNAVSDSELKARLLDITWSRLRDSEAARQAVQAYLDSARNLFDPKHWTAYAARVERAVRCPSSEILGQKVA